MMTNELFFPEVKATLFNGTISHSQMSGMLDLLAYCEPLDLNGVSYVFAGVYHETGRMMVPVREGFAKTDAGARSAVAKLKAQGRIKTDYAWPINGQSYFGRGRIQNTWLKNYQKLEKRFNQPFVKNPSLLLDSKIDAEVTIIGHIEGIWTGKKLSDYGANFKAARAIVNGTDKADAIALYALKFKAAFVKAGWGYTPAELEKALPVLRLGAKGEAVAKWQAAIGIKPVDGDFGPATRASTKNWQLKNGLVADGIVGPRSWEKVNV